jgi:glucose/arabinose dehydrogenase
MPWLLPRKTAGQPARPRRAPASHDLLLTVVRRSALAVALAVAVGVTLASCSGGDGDRAARRARSTTTTSTTVPPTTTTLAPNLALAAVRLSPVAEVSGGTALALRMGDPALYVAQQGGQVVAVHGSQVDSAPVLDLSGRLVSDGEQGLLGIAFSPDGTKLYVHYSGLRGETVLQEYAFTDGHADPTSARTLLTVEQPQPNHNGGQLTFGPDGLLYLGLGDGGAGGDEGAGHAPQGNGQSLDTLLGKILRIDPTPSGTGPYTIPGGNPFASGGGRPEIWVYGLRNPWRFSFDRDTGNVWIADVGQGAWEEIDQVPFANAAGANYGWPNFEGTHPYRGGTLPNAVAPVFETSHDEGNCSITGGYVYRGTRIPDLRGSYVFADYCRPNIRAVRVEAGRVVAERDLRIEGASIASFGEDAAGELYVLSQSDGLFRLDPA